ncbi:MAG TPA: HAD family hydrolase [Thermoplasmata archaeon]|nr:HAD family hydrolase [Thermoplasmata archaeon]
MPRGERTIDAVLFDLGGTLIDNYDVTHWAELAQRCFVTVDEEELAHAVADVERETDVPHAVPRDEWTVPDFWQAILSRAAGRAIDVATTERFLALARAEPGSHRLYSDSRRCLEELRDQGRRLGIVSNSSSEARVRTILDGAGVLSFFERVVSSGSEGVAKPDPEIFRRALARMHVPAHRALYVGNLAFTDARAARAAGLHAVWLNRAGTGMGSDPPEITSLLEVPLCVRRLENGQQLS